MNDVAFMLVDLRILEYGKASVGQGHAVEIRIAVLIVEGAIQIGAFFIVEVHLKGQPVMLNKFSLGVDGSHHFLFQSCRRIAFGGDLFRKLHDARSPL